MMEQDKRNDSTVLVWWQFEVVVDLSMQPIGRTKAAPIPIVSGCVCVFTLKVSLNYATYNQEKAEVL